MRDRTNFGADLLNRYQTIVVESLL